MRTTSFAAYARRFFINRQQGSEEKRKTMKFLKSLLVLTILGMSTAVHAEGMLLITPARIDFIESNLKDRATILHLKETTEDGQNLNNTCAGTARYIVIFKDDPRHDQVYTMIMTTLLAERRLYVYVLCDGGGGRFGDIQLY